MPRDSSRLLVLRRAEIEHRTFRELASCLHGGDVLVLNETRVIAARLVGRREPTGGTVELLLLRPARPGGFDATAVRWQALARPGRRARQGQRISFGDLGTAHIAAVQEDGVREVDLLLCVPFEEFLERAGSVPLPPYIHERSERTREQYQTIFARRPGSVAAPTASLHFTQRVFDELAARGVQIVKLTLDVGLGTFRPMQSERIADHRMHGEFFDIPPTVADGVARAKEEGRRVVAAGTTVMRALEGSAQKHGLVRAGSDETDLFITPGFRFRVVDALVTNFHLPRSTLLVLVCAFAGREPILRAYAEAIARGYRFFSFGDAMYIEP